MASLATYQPARKQSHHVLFISLVEPYYAQGTMFCPIDHKKLARKRPQLANPCSLLSLSVKVSSSIKPSLIALSRLDFQVYTPELFLGHIPQTCSMSLSIPLL